MILKKILRIIIMLVLCVTLIGCEIPNDDVKPGEDAKSINITYSNIEQEIVVGERFYFGRYIGVTPVYYESSDEDVLKITSRYATGTGQGIALVTAKSYRDDKVMDSFLVRVVANRPKEISIINYKDIEVGEKLQLTVDLNPSGSIGDILFESSDEKIATINRNGLLTGISKGFVRITASVADNKEICDEVVIYVEPNSAISGSNITNQYQDVVKSIDVSDLENVFEPIIKRACSYTIGVNSFKKTSRGYTKLTEASGIIYERYVKLNDGSYLLDDGTINNFVCYKYNVITCKHVIKDANYVEIYYEGKSINANVISYDTKIDLGVISFEDTRFFPTAKFGDSEDVETGEFILTVGSNYGRDYPDSITMGIVSYNSRYVSTDTDGDSTSDWDSLYIQHDAAIGEGSSGGPLVNMKGEVIGINSVKINSDKIDHMGFAIPSNLTIELCDQLKQGIVPVRPVFKISVLTVRDILNNEYLQTEYPIPEGINYGIYIAEVDKGGVGDICGMKAGDIIVEFDGKKITYSYELRAAMGQVIIGSGEEINVVVYRNGEYITLKAVF